MKEAAIKKLEQRADFEQIHKIVKIENKGKKGKKKSTPLSNEGKSEKSVTATMDINLPEKTISNNLGGEIGSGDTEIS